MYLNWTYRRNRRLVTIPFLALLLVALLAAGVQAAGDPAVGKAIFTGQQPLQGGGPACISCHSVQGLSGGSLKDLTGTYSQLGAEGVVAIIQDPPPLMKGVFANSPITDEEIGHLAAFLAEISTAAGGEASTNQGGAFDPVFPMIGLAGALFLIIMAQFIWSKRARGVRQQLVGGSRG